MRAKILNASAGSGKTYQLAYKYVRDVIDQPGLYRHILAVTFTNKATEEMKSRILKEIHRLASGGASPYLGNLCRELSLDERSVRKRAAEVRSKILHDYSRFTVLTIDTFFQRILRAFIKELGIDLNYNVEIETASVLSKGADTLIEQITVDRDLQRWLTEFVQERIDEGRKWDIRDGILSLGGELFKEKNKDALSVPRSREELGRIVSRAAAQAEATKKQLQQTAARAVAIISRAGLTAADFSGKSRSFANYFFTVAAGELKHGPIALVDEGEPVVFIVPPARGRNVLHAKVISGIEEVKARGAYIIAVAEENDPDVERYADVVFWRPACPTLMSPLVDVVPLQLFAMDMAKLKNYDVDKPRNLAKSVTVE